MSAENVLGLVLAVLLIVFTVLALLYPERFLMPSALAGAISVVTLVAALALVCRVRAQRARLLGGIHPLPLRVSAAAPSDRTGHGLPLQAMTRVWRTWAAIAARPGTPGPSVKVVKREGTSSVSARPRRPKYERGTRPDDRRRGPIERCRGGPHNRSLGADGFVRSITGAGAL